MSDATPARPSALVWLWLSAAVIVLDQASKWLIVQNLGLYEIRVLLPVLDHAIA